MPPDICSPGYLKNNSKEAVLTGVCRCDVFVKILFKNHLLIPFLHIAYSRQCCY